MKLLCLVIFMGALTIRGETVTLTWDPSPDAVVTGYVVCWGGESGKWTNRMNAGNALTARVDLPSGSWVVVKAYDANNNESDPSNEIGPINLAPQVGCLTNQTICAGQPFLFNLNVASGETFTYQWQLNGVTLAGATNAIYSVASATVANAGTYTVTVTGATGAASRTALLMVGKAPVSVMLSNLFQTYDGMGKPVSIVTPANNLPASCTYDDRAEAPTNAGSYTVIGTINDANYAGSTTNILIIVPASQTIAFPPLPDQARTSTVNLSATASSGLPVEFAVLSGPAQILGSQLTFTAAGTVSLVARQAGNSNYLGAVSVANTFAVTNDGSALLALATNWISYVYTYNSTNLPPAQALTVLNCGEIALTFTNIVTYSAGASNWLAIAPDNRALPAGSSLVLIGTVAVTKLVPGTYYATNFLVSSEAINSPQVWVMQLTVSKAEQTTTVIPVAVDEPGNGVTSLKFLTSEPLRGTNCEVTGHVWHWHGTPGQRYDIEAIKQLNGGKWIGVSGGTNLPGSETMTWTNFFCERPNQYEFFRIRARAE